MQNSKPKDRRKDSSIYIRATPDEHQRMIAAATAAGFRTLSAYIRFVVLQQPVQQEKQSA